MPDFHERLSRWAAGISNEHHFWDLWLGSRGLSWPEDFARRLDPEAPLAHLPASCLLARGVSEARVLDVGAGLISGIGCRLPGVALDITAVDPLAPLYQALLARHGVAPPLLTRFGTAEELTLLFPPGSFDLVACRNALDHSSDPMLGIRQMLGVVKVGGEVVLEHLPNEAEAENYIGFHQWNFDIVDGRFVIWNGTQRIDVAAALAGYAVVEATRGAWVNVIIRKTAEGPPPPLPPGLTAAALEAEVRRLIDAAPPPGTPAAAG